MRKICFGLVVAVLQALHEKDQQLKAVGEAVVAQVRLRHFPSFGCRTSIFVVSGAWMFCLHSFFGCHVHISLLLEAAQFDRKKLVSFDVSSTLFAIAGHVMLHASLLGHMSIYFLSCWGRFIERWKS